uniref:Uncharacterized protein n=1 Tax=Ixodes ricinus TaxID=34613 RepID=A0A6B0UTT1_IXORI
MVPRVRPSLVSFISVRAVRVAANVTLSNVRRDSFRKSNKANRSSALVHWYVMTTVRMSVNQVNRAFSTSTYAAVFRFFFAVLEPLALTVAMMLSFNFKIVESELCEMPYLSATVFFFFSIRHLAIIFTLISRARTSFAR